MELYIKSIGIIFFIIISFIFALRFSYTDFKSRKIYNKDLALFLPFCILISLLSGNFLIRLIDSGVIFLIGMILFKCRQMGGGDVKLITLYALIIKSFMIFLLLVSIIGGAITLIYMILYYFRGRWSELKNKGIPYGVAISISGFLISILNI